MGWFCAASHPWVAFVTVAAESKDTWDKLQSVSGLLSGILVAAIGAFATLVYNNRQAKAQSLQVDREVAVQQVQTVATLLPFLSSSDALEKEAALLSISALGKPGLAVRLAAIYRDEGSVQALARIASHGADATAAVQAGVSLDAILEARRASVVEVIGPMGPTATGFVVREDGLIATVDYAAREVTEVATEDGQRLRCETVAILAHHGVALLQLDSPGPPALALARTKNATAGEEEVVCLGFSPQGWFKSRGRIEGVAEESMGETAGYRGELLVASMPSMGGNAGAPILDRSGAVVGTIYGALGMDAIVTYVLPVRSLRAALSEMDIAVN